MLSATSVPQGADKSQHSRFLAGSHQFATVMGESFLLISISHKSLSPVHRVDAEEQWQYGKEDDWNPGSVTSVLDGREIWNLMHVY